MLSSETFCGGVGEEGGESDGDAGNHSPDVSSSVQLALTIDSSSQVDSFNVWFAGDLPH